ncbi:hypothetical protein RvY_00884-2 [Ramazzottius varieornatus]|uniref:Secreted protein n=1 Tax=Ramazzottius varieornatus TaxID=947166 RepID=A0A1D1UID4_RAMVA|nr:hypothetical protein RvY_00884-2 [Ramazzottius varieornatus]
MESRKVSVGNLVCLLLTGCAVMFYAVPVTNADDTFQCCLAGWKSVRGVVICNRPCCEGYSTRHAVLPALGQVTYCSKEPMASSDSSSYAMIPPNVMAANRGQPVGDSPLTDKLKTRSTRPRYFNYRL